MFQRVHNRAGHYLLLLVAAAGLFLPNLGVPSLWDIDEPHNSVAAREMLEAGDWVVPTFNYKLRVDKPALLYWLQIGAYEVFGVNEFAARLPSALAAALTLLLTYELGRLLAGATAGLLAGLLLGSMTLFCAAAHFANPDALLTALTTLTFLVFWRGLARSGRLGFGALGVATGLAVLAKGPVGLVLPGAALGLFLLWSGRLRLLRTWRLGLGMFAFVLVAIPWYALVGLETKTDFLKGFFLTHNVGRYLRPMESHGGPVYYYLLVLALGLAPWSAFLGLTTWYAVRSTDDEGASDRSLAVRFLACWIGVYLVFFSLSGTKLPNYILPIYPPLAILTGWFLQRWWQGAVQPPTWTVAVSLACFALVGLGTAAGLLIASGRVELAVLRGRYLPGLEQWAILGIWPVLGAAVAWRCAARQRVGGLVASLVATGLLFTGSVAALGSGALEAHKAPRALMAVVHDQLPEEAPEVRVGCYRYYQPSLVFYAGQEVFRLEDDDDALGFLTFPIPVYLFLPTTVWETLKDRALVPYRELGRRRDLYRGYEVILVTNR